MKSMIDYQNVHQAHVQEVDLTHNPTNDVNGMTPGRDSRALTATWSQPLTCV